MDKEETLGDQYTIFILRDNNVEKPSLPNFMHHPNIDSIAPSSFGNFHSSLESSESEKDEENSKDIFSIQIDEIFKSDKESLSIDFDDIADNNNNSIEKNNIFFTSQRNLSFDFLTPFSFGPPLGPDKIGLDNFGNTCYFNSGIHCI